MGTTNKWKHANLFYDLISKTRKAGMNMKKMNPFTSQQSSPSFLSWNFINLGFITLDQVIFLPYKCYPPKKVYAKQAIKTS
jgi:hypothetical protein